MTARTPIRARGPILALTGLFTLLLSGCMGPDAGRDAPAQQVSALVESGAYRSDAETGPRFLSYAYQGVIPDGVHGWVQKYATPDLTGSRGDSASVVVLEVFADASAQDPQSWLVMTYDPDVGRARAPAGSSPWPYGWSFWAVQDRDGVRQIIDGSSVTASGMNLKCAGCHARAESGVPMVFVAESGGGSLNLQINVPTDDQFSMATPFPLYQQGNRASLNELTKPLDPARDRTSIQAFLAFFAAQAGTGQGSLPAGFENSVDLTVSDLAHFPPMDGDATSVPPGKGHFNNSPGCQSCHDAASMNLGPNRLPPMEFWAYGVGADTVIRPESHDLAANWSPYGDWSSSILGLGSRDPVWHAQIETERHRNPGVPSSAIDNVCFRCHGPMGEKQLRLDTNDQGALFDHCLMYLTATGEYLEKPGCRAYDTPTYTESQTHLRSAALARDGIACGFCHTIGPENADRWDGETWEVFYGHVAEYYADSTATIEDFQRRLVDHAEVPPYVFTALSENNLQHMVGPDSALFQAPMSAAPFDYGLETAEESLYIKNSQVCGNCHIVIVPAIPTGFQEGLAVSTLEDGSHPYYDRPEGCPADATFTANPITDPCVQLTYEQQTYFEFLNSGYPTPELKFECQTCHMELLTDNRHFVGQYETFGNVEEYRREYNRHTLMGINLFVQQMYQQFPNVLGVAVADPTVQTGEGYQVLQDLLNGEATIVDFATSKAHAQSGILPSVEVEVQDTRDVADGVVVTVLSTNNAGHKFPSGAGFRRGWLEVLLLGASGDTLWASGVPNEFGAICDGVCNADGTNVLTSEFSTNPLDVQPHRTSITAQDQVQIYEVREVDDTGVLAPRVLSLFHAVKDNRMLPSGWVPAANRRPDETRAGLNLRTIAEITEAELGEGVEDPYYTDPTFTAMGADAIEYHIPVSAADRVGARVVVQMRYQTIPPYYLLARFRDGVQNGRYGPETQRLIYFVSRLNLDLGLKGTNVPVASPEAFDVMDNWTMVISRTEATLR